MARGRDQLKEKVGDSGHARVANDIDWALSELKKRRDNYSTFHSYYNGKQASMISADRLRSIFANLFADFHINLCKAPVDALADRLQISSFSSLTEVKNASQEAWEVWERNRMARRAGTIHQETIVAGDAYVLVWPNAQGEPVIYPQSAHEVAVAYDPESPGKIVRAAKMWREQITTRTYAPPSPGVPGAQPKELTRSAKPGYRLNLYYPDRIEKYAALKKSSATSWPKSTDFKPYDPEGQGEMGWKVVNEWGEVPVFHFANSADLGEYGQSELKDALPVQDWANWTVFQLLVGVEFQALPQRYVINVEDPASGNNPVDAGADRLLAFVGGDRENEYPPQVGQFAAADLSQIARVFNLASQAMSVVTSTPVHHFLPTQEGPATPVSGESQKVADTKLQSKVADRQIAFGEVWGKALSLAVKMKRGQTSEKITLSVNWRDMRPRNEAEMWTIALNKLKCGVSRRQVLIELGYSDKQIDDFERENAPAQVLDPNAALDDFMQAAGIG